MNHNIRISAFALCLAIADPSQAQDTVIPASDVLLRIDTEEPITIRNARIEGDLDFTQLSKQTPGGSYGVKGGWVKEYYTKLRAPLTLENCVIDGKIITFREERRQLLLKEIFVAFDKTLTLRGCRVTGPTSFQRLTFYDEVILEDCVFEEDFSFEGVRFTKSPNVKGAEFVNGFKNEQTNWDPQTGELTDQKKKDKPEERMVTVVLRNPSASDIPIQFGDNHWNLSPRGASTLQAPVGTIIYLKEDGKKGPELLALTPDVAGQIVDVTRVSRQ